MQEDPVTSRTTFTRSAAAMLALAVLTMACGSTIEGDNASRTRAQEVPPAEIAGDNPPDGRGSLRSPTSGAAEPGAPVPRSSGRSGHGRGADRQHDAEPHRGRGAPTDDVSASAVDPAVLEDCRERFVIVPADEEAVRERVPQGFDLGRDRSGRPLVYVGMGSCERYTVNGVTRPTTWAAFMATIASPDGRGCMSRWPVVGGVKGDLVSCNLYPLFVAYDNPVAVAWGRQAAPDGPGVFAPDHVFDQQPLSLLTLGAPFRFEAGPSTPSPFTLDLVVRARPARHPWSAAFWSVGPSGTTVFRFASDTVSTGEARGTVRVEPDSEMAEILGTDEPTPDPGFATMGAFEWRYGEISAETVTSAN